MKQRLVKPSLFIWATLLWLPIFVFAQNSSVTTSNENLRDLERYQSQLEEYESEFGPFDNNLLEPIAGMINLYAEQEDFQQVAELQSRQLSIMRTNLGLEHPDLIPVVRSMIEVQQVLGDWEAVADHLEHIRFLVAANYGGQSPELLIAMDNQAQWLLAGFYLHEERRQSDNFLDARELYRDMFLLSEDIYGKDDPALYPWYYKRAYNLALLVQLLNTEDGFSSVIFRDLLRSDGPGRLEQGRRGGVFNTSPFGGIGRRPPLLDRNSLLGEGYLRQGLGFINDIRDIAQQQGDLETEAMANLYRGDFTVLMERGTGKRQYNDAQEKLLAAGISQESIDDFFSKPMPLPVPEFFSRFEDLLAYQQGLISEVGDATDDALHLGTFRAWHENARAVMKPVSSDPLLRIGVPQYQVDLRFDISTRGNVSNVDVLNSIPDDSRVRREGSRAIREVKFRPMYAGDRAERVRNVQIRYFFAQQ